MLPYRSPLFQTPRKPEVTRRVTSLGLSSEAGWASGERSGVPIASSSSPKDGGSPEISRVSTPTPASKDASKSMDCVLVDLRDGPTTKEQPQTVAADAQEGETEMDQDGAPDAPDALADSLAPIRPSMQAGPVEAAPESESEPEPEVEPEIKRMAEVEVDNEVEGTSQSQISVSDASEPTTTSTISSTYPHTPVEEEFAPISLAPVLETNLAETDITATSEVREFKPVVLSPVLEKNIAKADITTSPRQPRPPWITKPVSILKSKPTAKPTSFPAPSFTPKLASAPAASSTPKPTPASASLAASAPATSTAPAPTSTSAPSSTPTPTSTSTAAPSRPTPSSRPAQRPIKAIPKRAQNGMTREAGPSSPQGMDSTPMNRSIPSAPVLSPLNSLQLHTDPSPMSPPRAQHGDPVSPLDPVSPWPPRDVPDTDLSDDRNASSNSRSKHPSQTTTGLPSAKEVYGSLAVLLTYLAFGTYLVWASAPAGSLDRVGWTWYPSREWAIVVPCWLMLVVLLTYFSYAGLTLFLTPRPGSKNIMVDEYSTIRAKNITNEPFYWQFAEPTAVPQAVDLPLSVVNAVLYPRRAGGLSNGKAAAEAKSKME